MAFEYYFSGGGFDISLIQVDSGRYFIRIYSRTEIGGHRIIAFSDLIPLSHCRSWIKTLRISTGDMIRLLYGDPLTFALRLKQYEVESMLEEL